MLKRANFFRKHTISWESKASHWYLKSTLFMSEWRLLTCTRKTGSHQSKPWTQWLQSMNAGFQRPWVILKRAPPKKKRSANKFKRLKPGRLAQRDRNASIACSNPTSNKRSMSFRLKTYRFQLIGFELTFPKRFLTSINWFLSSRKFRRRMISFARTHKNTRKLSTKD